MSQHGSGVRRDAINGVQDVIDHVRTGQRSAIRLLLACCCSIAVLLTSCSSLADLGIGPTATPQPPLFRYDTAIATAEAGSDAAAQAAAYLARGDAHADQGEYEVAISDYSLAIAREASNARAYNNRAIAYQTLAQFEPALADFAAAIRIDPGYIRAYKNRVALLEQTKGNLNQLAVDYGRLAELEPVSAAEYRYRQGSALQELNDNAGALAAYNAALATDVQQVDALYQRALLHYAQGRPIDALSDLDRAITLSPRAANAYYARGLVKHTLGDTPAALADFSQSLALNPTYAEALLARATLLHATGEISGASADLDRLEQLTLSEDLQLAATILRRTLP